MCDIRKMQQEEITSGLSDYWGKIREAMDHDLSFSLEKEDSVARMEITCG